MQRGGQGRRRGPRLRPGAGGLRDGRGPPARWPPMTGSEHRPLYARMLRLHHLAPSGLLCFVFLEGAIALGILLALAELVSWWGVIVLPVTVALMVKLNDVIAGSLSSSAAIAHQAAARPARPQ